MQTSMFRSVVLTSSLVLLAAIGLSLLLPELQGNWSQKLTITGTVETGTFTPANLVCEKKEKSRVLSWKPATGAESYILYHRGPFSHQYREFTEVDAPATTYQDLEPSYFRHRWYVTSSYGSWESDPSNSIKVYCRPDTSFSGPKKPKAENHHSQRTVELSWEATSGAVLYGVVRADENDGTYELLDTTTDTSYTDTSAADGITYYYLVVALDAEGNESDPSEVVTVPDTPPTDGLTPTPGHPDNPGATPTPTTTYGCDPDCPAVVNLGNVTVMMGGMGTVHLTVQNVPEPGLGAWSIEIMSDRNVVVAEGCVAHDGSCNPDYAAGTIQIVGVSGGKIGDSTLASISFSCMSVGASGLAIVLHVLQDASAGGGQPIVTDIQNGGVTCVDSAGSTPGPTATETSLLIPTATPTPTPVPPIDTPAPTPTLSPTPAPEPTATPTPTLSPTPAPEPTATPMPAPEPTATPTLSAIPPEEP